MDRGELDEEILAGLDEEEYRTAEEVFHRLPVIRRNHVDGRVIGGRLRSLHGRGYVVKRTAPDGYRAEWKLYTMEVE